MKIMKRLGGSCGEKLCNGVIKEKKMIKNIMLHPDDKLFQQLNPGVVNVIVSLDREMVASLSGKDGKPFAAAVFTFVDEILAEAEKGLNENL